MTGTKVYGWLTVGISGLLVVAITVGKASRPVAPATGLAMWVIAWLVAFIGFGLLKRSNAARLAFLVWAPSACYGVGAALLQRITSGKVAASSIVVALCGFTYSLPGFGYFLRPSVKAQFQKRA